MSRINVAALTAFYNRLSVNSIALSQRYYQLLHQATTRYASSPIVRRQENHHIIPRQIADGLAQHGVTIPSRISNIMVRLPAEYHRVITNEIEAVFPKSQTFANVQPNLQSTLNALEKIYYNNPLP